MTHSFPTRRPSDLVAEKDVWLIRKSKELYLPWLDQAIARPWPFILGGLAFFVAAIPAFGLLGSEFIPQLDEKNLAFASTRVPSVSLDQSLAMERKVEEAVIKIPEVALRSEEHTSELQSLMRISYAVFCLKKKTHPIDI